MSLRTLREKAGLTQQELGQRLAKAVPPPNGDPRYYQPRISSYETGRNNVPLAAAIALVKILNRALKRAGVKHVATVEELVTPPE